MKPQQTRLQAALGLAAAPWAYKARNGKLWHLSHDADRMLCGRRIRPARYFPLYGGHAERLPLFTCQHCAGKLPDRDIFPPE